MSAPNESPRIATQAELLMRLRKRDAPRASLELRPDGQTVASVHRKIADENEKRLRELKQSLDTARAKTETDHTFSRLEGFPSAQFDRVR